MLANFLQMIRCSPMPSDSPEPEHRLLPHPNVVCWGSEHEPLRQIAFWGLGVWCCGIPLALGLRIRCLKGEMNDAMNYRTYGYFTVGLEPDFWYWDLLIQRADVALMLFVAYTSISDHESAKLLLFPIISGLMLGATAWVKPYENEQGEMLDFLVKARAITGD
ncbi:ZEP, partial [Symbiodinium pilosum]